MLTAKRAFSKGFHTIIIRRQTQYTTGLTREEATKKHLIEQNEYFSWR